MGFYGERVFPRIINVVMNTKEKRRVRQRVCADLEGEMLEIGFGTGHNVPFMPVSVSKLLAVDPLMRGRDLARDRIASAPFDVEFVGLDGEQLALADHCVDAALLTWTLCSVSDPVAVTRELCRVLRPSGTLHFVEHGLSPDERVREWQHRLNGLEKKIACGCHLTRDIPALLLAGGMSIERLDTYYAKREPKPWGWTFEGLAKPA